MQATNEPAKTDREALIDKVQKLLAMAESTTHPEEAKSFRDKAADLMAKHAIENNEFASAPTYMIVDLDFDAGPTTWQIHMTNAIAKFNGMLCVLHTTHKGYDKHKLIKLIGTASDHAAFTYMYDSVMRQMGTALGNYLQETGKTNTTNRTQFMVGFSYGLSDKVRDLMDARNNKIQQYGLVPINETQKARNWYEETNGNLSKGKVSNAKYEMAGVNAGKNASLNKGVTSYQSNKLQIA